MQRRATVFGMVLAIAAALVSGAAAGEAERLFELRTYYAAEGKLDALHARFRDHTTRLFEKHGMENVGYWTPIDNPESKIVYALAYPSREAREAMWGAFAADPVWQEVRRASIADGELVARVESVFLKPTSYSPEPRSAAGQAERIFELRRYTATEGNLGRLDDRFRQATMRVFERVGMENVIYWHLADGQEGADRTLIYFIAHPSVDAAKASWAAFGSDPEWQAAYRASEQAAGGSLTEPGGVVGEYLRPTDYSPLR